MRAFRGLTWAGAALLAAAAAVSCGPSVSVETSGGTSAVASSGAGGAATSSTGAGGLCGDGIIQVSDHCENPASASYCAADCASDTTVGAGTGGACAGHVYYAGKFDQAPSAWLALPAALGRAGLDAGDAQCVALAIGADHVCDYEEVLAAQAQGALDQIPQGTTAWVQRTTTALVNGVPSAPGLGGNCIGWTYPGNLHADGEYVTFDQPGVPTFHLDNDATWDPNSSQTNVIVGDLECGGQTRSILCCYQACM